ncbi:MAG: MFS transporter [Treponema sp.]|nr:MFS transporter [Treponema sp.]
MSSLVSTLKGLRGNARVCVYTEPLWGLSMNLCLPYASVYMLALGLRDSQLGLVATVYMLSQVVWAFLSGPITDKMGRRRVTPIFDFLGWCIPCLIWWRAESFWFFFVAALLNGMMQIPSNSWTCLLIEDSDLEKIPGINSLVMVAGQLSVFFAPISAVLFSRLTLVPAIRILYLNAFVIMTTKTLLLYIFTRETRMGLQRMEETRGKSLLSLSLGYRGVLRQMLSSPPTLFALFVNVLAGIVAMINGTFWQVIVSQKLLVPDYLLPAFPILRSVVSIVFLFIVAPHVKTDSLKKPLLLGIACCILGQSLLILTPLEDPLRYLVLGISLTFDSLGSSFMFMLALSFMALNVNPNERARVQAILYMVTMAATAPFGIIGGLLSSVSRNLPFVLNIVLLIIGFAVTCVYYRKRE